jgi:tetratricopeptide (TPR) repeat protein
MRFFMKHAGVAAGWTFLVIATVFVAQPDTSAAPADSGFDKIRELNRPAVVTVIARDAEDVLARTAVLIDPKGIVATVAEGLTPSHGYVVHLDNGRKLVAALVALDHRANIAILRAESSDLLPYAVMGDSTELHDGDAMLLMDVELEDTSPSAKILVETVNLSETGSRHIRFISSRRPRRNGAPVFSEEGLLVALMTGDDETGGTGRVETRLAVPVNVLFGPLDQLGASSPSYRLEQRGRRAVDEDDRIRLLEASVRADPINASAHFYLAVAYGDRGKVGKQLELLKRFVELRPDSFEGHRNLGLIHMKMNNLDLAVRHLRIAAEKKPADARVHNDLGEAYRAKKMYREARVEMELALSLDPELAEAHFNMGLLTATVDNKAASAARHFQRYLDLRPGTPESGKLRQWMERQTGATPGTGEQGPD